jgi:hypothetical protein
MTTTLEDVTTTAEHLVVKMFDRLLEIFSGGGYRPEHTAGPAAPGRLVSRTRPRGPVRRPVPGSETAAVTGTM